MCTKTTKKIHPAKLLTTGSFLLFANVCVEVHHRQIHPVEDPQLVKQSNRHKNRPPFQNVQNGFAIIIGILLRLSHVVVVVVLLCHLLSKGPSAIVLDIRVCSSIQQKEN